MPFSFIALDTETTGLDFEHDRLVELAAVRFEDGMPVAEFEALFSPGDRAFSPVARLITGLTPEQLAEAPPAAESLRAFLAFAGDAPLLAHNAPFDAHFVGRALAAEGLPPLPGAWLDSLPLARLAWPDWESHRLDFLARRLRLDRDGEHRALPDARRAGQVFVAAREHVRTVLSAEARDALARVSRGLPEWEPLFAGLGDAAPAALAPGVSDAGAALSATADAPMDEALVAAAAGLLAKDAWSALETPAGSDDLRAAFEASLSAARGGKRVLLAVPDAGSWNALRKCAAATAEETRVAALAEPSAYLCRARLRALADSPDPLPPGERAALLPLIAWADTHPDGPAADGRAFSPDRARPTWARVQCDAWNDDPAALSARRAAESADVILVTHAALCAHAALEGALFPACDALVVAGAHRLPEALQRAGGREVSLFRLRDILLLHRPGPHDEGDPWFEADRAFQKLLQKAGRHASKARPQGDFRVRYAEPLALAFGADPAPALEALRANEAALREAAAADPEQAAALRRIEARLRAFRVDLEFLCDVRDENTAYWFEDPANPHKATLRCAARDASAFGGTLAGLFGAGLWLSPALIAGPNPGRDGRFFLRAAGLSTLEPAVSVQRHSDPAAAPRFLMLPSAPFLGSGEQAAEFARFLAAATTTTSANAPVPAQAGGVLVYCPSQTMLRALHASLRQTLPPEVPLWAQHIDGNREALARVYATTRGGFVLATDGIGGLRDADENMPALWVVPRMPLPPPRDPLLEARGELLREMNGNPRTELWQPAAVLRVKREWDALRRGGAPRTIWLLDGRAASEGLGAKLAGALGATAEAVSDLSSLAST